MNVIKNILLTIVIFIVVVIGAVFIFIKTFDLNKYLGPIMTQASQALGRDVKIAKADLAIDLIKGIALKVNDVSIADDPQFSKEPLLTLGEISADLDVMDLISRHELKITAINIDRLKIHLIQDENGLLNVQNIGPKTASGTTSNSAESAATTSTSSAVALPALLVKSIRANDAVIVVDINNNAMPMHLNVDHVSIAIDDFSLTNAFAIKVNLAFLAKQQNVTLNTQVTLDVPSLGVKIDKTDFEADLSLIDHDLLETTFPSLVKLPLPNSLKGKLNAIIQPFKVSPKAMGSIIANVTLVDAGLTVNAIPLTVAKTTANISLDLSNTSPAGSVDLDLQGGQLRGLDLSNLVIKQLSTIQVVGPLLAGYIQNGIDGSGINGVTSINQASLKATMAKSNVKITSFNLVTTPMTIDGQGRLGLASMLLDANLDVRISANLSARLIKKAKPMQGLLNDKNELYIPGRLKGILTGLKYLPDIDYISKKLVNDQAAQAIGNALDKVIQKNPEVGNLLNAVLGGDKNSEGQGTMPTSESGQQQEGSSKDLLKGLLNKIVK